MPQIQSWEVKYRLYCDKQPVKLGLFASLLLRLEWLIDLWNFDEMSSITNLYPDLNGYGNWNLCVYSSSPELVFQNQHSFNLLLHKVLIQSLNYGLQAHVETPMLEFVMI